jgi:hypothetical protein
MRLRFLPPLVVLALLTASLCALECAPGCAPLGTKQPGAMPADRSSDSPMRCHDQAPPAEAERGTPPSPESPRSPHASCGHLLPAVSRNAPSVEHGLLVALAAAVPRLVPAAPSFDGGASERSSGQDLSPPAPLHAVLRI